MVGGNVKHQNINTSSQGDLIIREEGRGRQFRGCGLKYYIVSKSFNVARMYMYVHGGKVIGVVWFQPRKAVPTSYGVRTLSRRTTSPTVKSVRPKNSVK